MPSPQDPARLEPGSYTISQVFDHRQVIQMRRIDVWSGYDAFFATSKEKFDTDKMTLDMLTPIPWEAIYPVYEAGLTVFTGDVNDPSVFLKCPKPRRIEEQDPSWVPNRLLEEARLLEMLAKHPHPNLTEYLGCVVDKGRIVRLAMRRYSNNLCDLLRDQDQLLQSDAARARILDDVAAAAKHLHSLGLAHNDISGANIVLRPDGSGVLIDYDSCLPFGEERLLGGWAGSFIGPGYGAIMFPKSCVECDELSLAVVREYVEKRGRPELMDGWGKLRSIWNGPGDVVEIPRPED